MSELIVIEILLMLLLFPAVVGVMYMKDFIMRYLLNRTKVIVLRKDGTYIKAWKKIGSSKSINVDKRERLVDPRGRFIGPEGNLFVFVGESSKPATVEEIQSAIDTDDVSTIATLSYFAGKMAGLKNMEQVQLLMYLNRFNSPRVLLQQGGFFEYLPSKRMRAPESYKPFSRGVFKETSKGSV